MFGLINRGSVQSKLNLFTLVPCCLLVLLVHVLLCGVRDFRRLSVSDFEHQADSDTSWIMPVLLKGPTLDDQFEGVNIAPQVSLDGRRRQLLQVIANRPSPYLARLTVTDLFTYLASTTRCLSVSNLTYLASGWTKAVYKGTLVGESGGQSSAAVKTVDMFGHDVYRCVRGQSGSDVSLSDASVTSLVEQCRRRASNKIIKEAYLLKILNSSHVIQVCSRIFSIVM